MELDPTIQPHLDLSLEQMVNLHPCVQSQHCCCTLRQRRFLGALSISLCATIERTEAMSH